MVFSTFTMLCIHHLYLLPKHFHYTKKNPYSFFPRFTLFLADMLCHILGTKENRILMWVFICIIGVAAAAKSLQSCPTLCDPTDSPVPGILQARALEWVAISFYNAWKWKVKVKLLSRVRLLATPQTVAHQVPSSMGFSSQEYWSGVPLPFPIIGIGLFALTVVVRVSNFCFAFVWPFIFGFP